MIKNQLAQPGHNDFFRLNLGHDVIATVDRDHGMVWLTTGKGLEVGISLFGDIEGTYFGDQAALGLSSSGAAGFVELPCTKEQAKQLFSAAGWNPTSLAMY
ncbi:hypothetical protein [Paraburkholderia sp. BL17N1]|uniref:hypothetical protein n=1 Tax=Paraburkholderia sp. BL17N1 TaxID=1938798 RepID=UPI0011C48CFE|nr:hypothetical protein [Paraburkholderia sp. BL17N1]